MKKYRFLRICCVLIVTFGWLCSCDPDDETISSTTDTNTSKVTKPTFDKFLSTTDTDGFSIRVRFKTCLLYTSASHERLAARDVLMDGHR